MVHKKEPPHLLGNSKNGGSIIEKVSLPTDYRNPPLSATNLAPSTIATRFRLPMATARVVCELAGIGGAA